MSAPNEPPSWQPPMPPQLSPPTPPPQSRAGAPWWKRRWVIGLAAFVLGLAIGGASNSGSSKKTDTAASETVATATTTATATATTTATATLTASGSAGPTVTATVPGPTTTIQNKTIPTKTVQVRVTFRPPPVHQFSDGTYRVGSEIPAGTYHTSGEGPCYWEKDRKGSGLLTKIIENDSIDGPTTIDIERSVYAFKTSGGCTWAKRTG